MSAIKYVTIFEAEMKSGVSSTRLRKYCKEQIIDCKQILPSKWLVGLTENGDLIYIKDLKAQKP